MTPQTVTALVDRILQMRPYKTRVTNNARTFGFETPRHQYASPSESHWRE
jgi:hypothetical protein